MPRLRTRPPLFRGRKSQTTTNAVRRGISNSALADHDVSDNNFVIDSYLAGFKSTQQLSLDFSKFSNHTFFSPARSKLDVALYKSINEYPYTGSGAEIDEFLFRLTGFEKYIFDSVPKNIGYLFFSGTQVTERTGGTYIEVKPYKGYSFPEAPGASGEAAIVIGQSPFEIEAHLYVPPISNDNQVIVQRLQGSAGYTLAISQSASTSDCRILFLVSSASDSYVIASGTFSKGNFSHVRACLFDEDGGKRAKIFVDQNLVGSSSDYQDFGSLSFDTSSLFIGSGSLHEIFDYRFFPRQTLSGAIDELRFFTDQRTEENIEKYKNCQIFSTSSLKLYFRFDEPSGSYDMNNVALDYSGECLHSEILNFSQHLRMTSSIGVPLSNQNPYYSPVLYPDFSSFQIEINNLITSASDYDEENPNIVTNFVPAHYLQESAIASGLSRFDSGIGEFPELDSIPGTGEMPRSSPLLSTLSLMSIQVDEIKQFIDSMSNLLAVELGEEEKINSQMIKYAADYFGIDLPNFFAKSTTEQFSFGNNVNDDELTTYTLRSLRDDLWRRIISNMSYVNSAKGTKSAVRSIMLSSGIVPENFFTIREYGMSGEARLSDLRDQTIEVTSMVNFSGSLTTPSGSISYPGFRTDSPRIVSTFLSASRVEKGFPEIGGSFVNTDAFPPHGISNNPNDGLMTSGSFFVEASYVFDKSLNHPMSQSLMRLAGTGSALNSSLYANIIYVQGTQGSGTLRLGLKPSMEASGVAPASMILFLTGVNIFDGERWTVGLERARNDEIGLSASLYTLKCARQVGNQANYFSTSSYYTEVSTGYSNSAFQGIDSSYNASGSQIIVGSQSIDASTRLLNSEPGFLYSNFTGKVSHIKFFSSRLDDSSFIEHARNFASIGTSNPEISLGFDLVQTGAFQRMRIDASCDQATTSSDSAGNIRIFDFSQNSLHLSGSGFRSGERVIVPYLASVDRISPRFDLQQVSNKVRVRGLDVPTQTDSSLTISGPVYEIYDVSEIVDDVRFSIEHSAVKALNEDIMTTVGTTQYIEDSLGNPIEMFNDSYSKIDHFSTVYFNRLTGKIDLARTYDVFRWVDVALTDLVESILPKRTKFLGINYIIEPHVLERGKIKYYSQESFMTTNMDGDYAKYSEAFGFYEPTDGTV